MKVQFVRHATLVVAVKEFRLLVDPMFSSAGTMDPSPNTDPPLKNPLVDIPANIDLASLTTVDAVLVTHTHRDHWDETAAGLLPRDIAIFCQPQDMDKIVSSGFTNVTAVTGTLSWNGIRMTRAGARHGTGDMGEKMGPVSGYILEAADEPTLYITGDTVWCREVEDACQSHPDVVIAFAGGAEFTSGGPITMTAEDIYQLSLVTPDSQIVAVHMDAWNHCLIRRNDLRNALSDRGVLGRVLIPNDGEILEFHRG